MYEDRTHEISLHSQGGEEDGGKGELAQVFSEKLNHDVLQHVRCQNEKLLERS